jgi:RNA polymerase sigma-70 factor (ECF subfamily)
MTQSPRSTPEPPPEPAADAGWPAFEAFVREQHPALCAYAYRYLRSREAAEEVVQDVLLRVWCGRERLVQVELIPYVYRSVAHAAVSRIRSERAIRNRDLRLEREAPRNAGSGEPETADELELRIRHAIEALPERSRLVFLLSRDAGLTYPAIAERLGISVKTVENQIVRALRLLRAALKPYLAVTLALAGAEQLLRRLF